MTTQSYAIPTTKYDSLYYWNKPLAIPLALTFSLRINSTTNINFVSHGHKKIISKELRIFVILTAEVGVK